MWVSESNGNELMNQAQPAHTNERPPTANSKRSSNIDSDDYDNRD